MRDTDDPVSPTAKTSEFCSTREAAQLLHVSIKTAQVWVETGVLQAWKTPGGHRRIRRDSLNALLRERIPQSQPATIAKTTSLFTILVVDDDPRLIELYRLNIELWGMPLRVVTAPDGFTGLIRIGEERPDLLIIDLNMPGINGFRMISTLRSAPSCARLRVIIVSGLSPADIQDQGGLPSDVEFFSKPIPFEALRLRVEAILNEL